jgi:hypothetical protein
VIQAELAVLEKLIIDNKKIEKELLMDVIDAERNGEVDEDAIDALANVEIPVLLTIEEI